MSAILEGLRAELVANADEATKKSGERFFKEKVTLYGVKTAIVGKIAKKYWLQVKALSKQEIFGLCEALYQSDYMEEAFVVSNWMPEYMEHLEAKDIFTFKHWIECYINNWAKCDGFCNHTVGDMVQKYPEIVAEIKSWTQSANRWMKRASAVSFIIPAKQGLFLKDAIEIANTLLTDQDDMVQKGYGWLLKEESRCHEEEVFNYVVKNRAVMPRTALRYAIELMPKELKLEAMKKE
jgi:3-methyladenine DNA glycosylase AlkD